MPAVFLICVTTKLDYLTRNVSDTRIQKLGEIAAISNRGLSSDLEGSERAKEVLTIPPRGAINHKQQTF